MISIIVPVYKSEKTLEKCIKSLLSQTDSDFEILLVVDGLKTALSLMKAMSFYNKSLRECVEELNIYPQLLVNEKVYDKNIVLNDEDIKNKIDEISNILGSDGRILVRPSGTEPLIRVMVEAKSDDICNKYVYEVIDLIKAKGYAQA